MIANAMNSHQENVRPDEEPSAATREDRGQEKTVAIAICKTSVNREC